MNCWLVGPFVRRSVIVFLHFHAPIGAYLRQLSTVSDSKALVLWIHTGHVVPKMKLRMNEQRSIYLFVINDTCFLDDLLSPLHHIGGRRIAPYLQVFWTYFQNNKCRKKICLRLESVSPRWSCGQLSRIETRAWVAQLKIFIRLFVKK